MTEDTSVGVQASLGLVEGEITEHSMRKIMECLIADFPLGPGGEDTYRSMVDKPQTVTMTEPDEQKDEEECIVVKSRTITANLVWEGLNYKMRLRKEETVLKIIDLSLDFNDYVKD